MSQKQNPRWVAPVWGADMNLLFFTPSAAQLPAPWSSSQQVSEEAIYYQGKKKSLTIVACVSMRML